MADMILYGIVVDISQSRANLLVSFFERNTKFIKKCPSHPVPTIVRFAEIRHQFPDKPSYQPQVTGVKQDMHVIMHKAKPYDSYIATFGDYIRQSEKEQ